ncbi:MAG: exopolysaccharide biosynthesis polyprenyl glycosylphosphotransferase [Candidatus Eisenbacteria bacterium]|nr:exopolysaccharide biosynthesis polyprenyl glycosylphosphotransferase [Candidatus Eisenbacteria bacterium]
MAVRPQQVTAQLGREWSAHPGHGRVSVGRIGFYLRSLPVLLLADALLLMISFWAAHRWILGGSPDLGSALAPHITAMTSVLTLLMLGFLVLGGMLGLPDARSWPDPRRPRELAVRALRWAAALGVGLMLLLALEASQGLPVRMLQALLFLGLAVTSAPLLGRVVVRAAAHDAPLRRRVLIVGGDMGARRVAGLLDWEIGGARELVGLTDLRIDRRRGRRWPRFAIDGWEDVPALAGALAVDEVILASGELPRRAGAQIARRLARAGIETGVVPHLTDVYVHGAPVHWSGSLPLVHLGRPGDATLGLRLKRAFDLIAALCATLLLSPLMLAITVAVKLSSPGPVFHAQQRVGRDGRRFYMYKFRSMVASNDDARHRRYVASLVRDGDAAGVDECGRPVYKILDDPRITAVGRLLRRMSLDELPQLFNVIRGEMSLVGPRPPLPFEYELYEPWQRVRLDATPGMTGLWQVSGRSYLSFEEMVLLDLFYAANWSFLLDLKLIWRTIPEVFCARGAR